MHRQDIEYFENQNPMDKDYVRICDGNNFKTFPLL